MLKISVITLCKNNQDTIADAMQSFANQDYNYKEHIVIDGASTDSTLQIVKSYNPDILVSEPDKGMYYAANKGIDLATGDVIAFLHADDLFATNDVLSKMAALIESSASDSAYANLVYVDRRQPDKVIRYWHSGVYKFNTLKFGWMPPHPTFFVKTEIYRRYGKFDTSYTIAADYDIMLRFLCSARISAAYCDCVTVKMRVGGISNKSLSNIWRKMRDDYRAARKNSAGGIITVIFKNLRKIKQLFCREKVANV